jgi:hypothetical protein
MRADLRGRFRPYALGGLAVGWLLATDSEPIAHAVSGALSGLTRQVPAGWEVAVPAGVLQVRVDHWDGDALRFRLAALPDLGAFTVAYGPWALADVLRGTTLLAEPDGPVLAADLTARAVQVTTRAGRLVRFLAPA